MRDLLELLKTPWWHYSRWRDVTRIEKKCDRNLVRSHWLFSEKFNLIVCYSKLRTSRTYVCAIMMFYKIIRRNISCTKTFPVSGSTTEFLRNWNPQKKKFSDPKYEESKYREEDRQTDIHYNLEIEKVRYLKFPNKATFRDRRFFFIIFTSELR